jgi:hypothetical protein
LERSSGTATISAEPFGKISAATKKAATAFARRYGRILDVEIDVTWP